MSLSKALIKDNFVITCELAPPKGTDVSSISSIAKSLKNKIHAINLTDGQGGNMRMSPLACAIFLLKEDVDVIWQLTCRDRNRIALQADCLGAYAIGIKNVLAMRGDDPKSGDNPDAKAVFDLDTTELVKMILKLNSGFDLAEKELKGKTNFFIGCPAHPGMSDLEKQYKTLKERFDLGAHFMQTQICYDLEKLKLFVDSLKDLAPKTIVGITPLKNLKMATFMNEKVFGVNVPDSIFKRLEKFENAEDQRKIGLEISLEIVSELKKLNVGGIHVMAVGQESKLPEIIDFFKD